jgi:glycosyltransferase involved in cell wall biosynthesis
MSTLGAALIVKNEEVMLPRCLESLKGIDAIFISDTGSTDKTIEVAKKYTENVWNENFWHDSFADARNFIREKVTTDWILSIDADEFLHDLGAVREAVALAEAANAIAVNCKLIGEGSEGYFQVPRLFRNDPRCYWNGNAHNHLSVTGGEFGDVRITHGFSPAHLKDPDRTFRILQKDVKEVGGSREKYYLGREYFYRGEYEKAVYILGEYVQGSRFMAEKADAFLVMAKAYWQLHRGDDARDACAQCLIINSHFKEACLFMAEISWPHLADQWKRMAETANNKDVLFVRQP